MIHMLYMPFWISSYLFVKQFVPDLKQVFYWTDSPTSQFRNKTIFHITSEHKEEYNCVAKLGEL